MTDDLVKRLLGRTKQHLPGNWREGLKCPECDVMADRPKCMWDMGRSCPRHDPHNYEPSPFETKPDTDCHEAADRIEALTAQLETVKEAHDDVEQYARRHCAEVEALTAERDDYKRIATHSDDVVTAARAEIERLGCALNVAKYGQPDFAWSVHLDAMAGLRAEIERLREAHRFSHLHVEALSEIKAVLDGGLDQTIKEIMDGLLKRIAASAALKGQQP